jgi:hypothetical protein
MAYDPTKPVEDSPLDAAEMRNQLQGLKILIDAKATGIGAVQPLNITLSDPVSTDEVQAILDKLNEVIAALKQ